MLSKILKVGLLAMAIASSAFAQSDKDAKIIGTLKAELKRSMDSLSLPGMKKPFFIQYYMNEGQTLILQASLGSLTKVYDRPLVRVLDGIVLVGDYKNNNVSNYNYAHLESPTETAADNDYKIIRHDLWLMTDKAYKQAVEQYNQKVSQQSQDKDQDKADTAVFNLMKIKPFNSLSSQSARKIDRKRVEDITKELSSVFNGFVEIDESQVSVQYFTSKTYSVSSEGSTFSMPNSFLRFSIDVQLIADDGQVIKNGFNIMAPNEDELPPMEQMKNRLREYAREMTLLKHAVKLKNFYSGPVLFTGDAAAVLLANSFFYRGGLSATIGEESGFRESFQDRMGTKVMDTHFDITLKPLLTTFGGKKLIGSYQIDADGIPPVNNLRLVEKGILKNLIGSRIGTSFYKRPTGTNRVGAIPGQVQMAVIPGVVEFSTSNGVAEDKMKAMLIATARENGSEYAYIVKSIGGSKNFVERYFPAVAYRIRVKDGQQEMIRGAEFAGFAHGLLKQITAASDIQQVYNANEFSFGTSYICPSAILLPDVELKINKDIEKVAKPVVSNPLSVMDQKK